MPVEGKWLVSSCKIIMYYATQFMLIIIQEMINHETLTKPS